MRIQIPPVEVQIMFGNVVGDFADSELQHVDEGVKKLYGKCTPTDNSYAYLSGHYEEPRRSAVHYFGQILARRTQNLLAVRTDVAKYGGLMLVIAPPKAVVRTSNSWHILLMPNRIGAYMIDPERTFA